MKARKAAPPARTLRLSVPPTPDEPGVLVLTAGKQTTAYFVEPLAADYGEAFALTKFDGTVYHVNLGGAGEYPDCSCWGFQRWGFKAPCKHLSALLALKELGVL